MGLFNFPQVDSDVNVIFSIDGDEYAVEQEPTGRRSARRANHDCPFANGEKQYLRMGHQAVGKEERGGAVQDRYVRCNI